MKKVNKNSEASHENSQHRFLLFLVKQPTAMGITLVMPGSYLNDQLLLTNYFLTTIYPELVNPVDKKPDLVNYFSYTRSR